MKSLTRGAVEERESWTKNHPAEQTGGKGAKKTQWVKVSDMGVQTLRGREAAKVSRQKKKSERKPAAASKGRPKPEGHE